MERYRSWFGVQFEFLLYDVTSTFFEGQAEANEKAARGYSRDSRPDCKQVCLGMVCTPEGLPLSYEVFAGNRSDVTTVEEIVRTMEEKYGVPRRVWGHGPRHGQRAKHRVPARTRRALFGRHAQEPASAVRVGAFGKGRLE